jgi:hypothetical protein
MGARKRDKTKTNFFVCSSLLLPHACRPDGFQKTTVAMADVVCYVFRAVHCCPRRYVTLHRAIQSSFVCEMVKLCAKSWVFDEGVCRMSDV